MSYLSGKYDDLSSDTMKKRETTMELSKRYDSLVVLPLQFSQSQRLILPQTRIEILLEHAHNKFRLMNATETANVKLVIDQINLHVTRLWLSPSMVESIYSKFSTQGVVYYPIRRTVCTGPVFINSGQTVINIDYGRSNLPLAMLTFFVRSTSYHGALARNPLQYPPMYISQSIARHGSRTEPSQLYTYSYGDLSNEKLSPIFADVTRVLSGSLRSSEGRLEYTRWLHDQNFFAYIFDPIKLEGGFQSETSTNMENLSLHMTLAKAPTESYQLMTLLFYDNCVQYSINGSVICDYIPGSIC